jgi:predicted Holliday junction resolvase-like endonuclease
MDITLFFFFIFLAIFVFIIFLFNKIKQINNANNKKSEDLQNEILIKDDEIFTNNDLSKKNLNTNNIDYSLSDNIYNNKGENVNKNIDETVNNEIFQNGFNAKDGILYTEIFNKKYF